MRYGADCDAWVFNQKTRLMQSLYALDGAVKTFKGLKVYEVPAESHPGEGPR